MADNPRVEFRIRDIDDYLWRQFRALCALEDVKINTKIKQLIEEAVTTTPCIWDAKECRFKRGKG